MVKREIGLIISSDSEMSTTIPPKHFSYIFFFFIFMAIPTAYGSSWARDWIWAPADTWTTAAAMLDSLTYYTGLGIEPMALQQP